MENYLIIFYRSVLHHLTMWSKLSFCFLFLAILAFIQTPTSFGFSQTTLAEYSNNNVYSGQLLLTNIQLKSEVETHYIALLTATNLSSRTLELGTETAPDIQIKFEESFSRHPLNPYREEIIEALLDTNLQILARKTTRGVELLLEKTKPLAEKYIGQEYSSQLFKVKKKKSASKKRKILKPLTKKEKNDPSDSEIEIAENVDLKSLKKETQEQIIVENSEIIVDPIEKTVDIQETETSEIKTEAIQEEIVLIPSADSQSEKTVPKPKKDRKPFIKLSKKKKVIQEEKESVSFTSNIEEETTAIEEYEEEEEPFYYNESACADIVIDSVVVVKNQKNKWITVQYTITNQGTKSADLYGKSGDDADNLAIKVFLASSENLTRGSIPVGGSFIKNGVDDGILLPNQSHTGTFKIDIRKKTSFTPFLIFSADHFNVMIECDKTNNKNHLFVQ